MKRSGWGASVALGALTTWLAAPWVSMAVHGTTDSRHGAWLRGEAGRQAGRAARPTGPTPGMPRAWDTIPGPRPRARGRSGAASS